MHSVFWFLVASLSVGLLLAGQGGQTGSDGGASTPPAPTTPGAPSAPTSPTTTTPSPIPTAPVPLFPETPMPMFLSGKVTLEDGTPPPERVAIELCGRRVAYTDSEGRFSFQVSATTTDASSRGDTTFGMGSPSERFCAIRAWLAGYRSASISLAERSSWANPHIGTIVLRRLGNVEGVTISMTSFAAPKDATKAFEKGSEAIRKEKWAEARKQLEKAVQIYPNYAAAWNELGTALLNSGNRAAARTAFEKAVAADAKFVSPYVQLAALGVQEGKWDDVVGTTAKALDLDPRNYPNLYFFDAVAHLNLRHLDQAEKSAREGLKLDSLHRFPFLHHALGVILVNKGEYEEAAGLLKTYLELAPNAGDAAEARKRLAEIEKVAQTRPATAQ